jgi:hypothetical protein
MPNLPLAVGRENRGGFEGSRRRAACPACSPTPDILTLTATGGTSTPPNNFDDIAGGIARLRTGPALASPDLLLLHPDTWANIRTQTDTLGLQAAPRVVRCPGRGPPSVGQGVRRCGHVARSSPDVARGGHGMSARRICQALNATHPAAPSPCATALNPGVDRIELGRLLPEATAHVVVVRSRTA